MFVGRVAVLTALMVTILTGLFIQAAPASPFIDAYGTFKSPKNTIDGDRATVSEVTKPYRGDYFLVVRFASPSLLRTVKVIFEGKKPKDHFVEMSENAMGWRPQEPGEKASYLRIRIPAGDGTETYVIAEVEAGSTVAPTEAFMPTAMKVDNVETTAASLTLSFTKPCRLSLAYGLEPRADALKNFTEYTSFQSNYTVQLSDLIEGQDYYARVKATTAEGEVYVSEDTNYLHFRLFGTPPLKLVGGGMGYVSPVAVSIVLQTNIPSHCVTYFGEPDMFNEITSRPAYDTRHVFEYKDLRPNHIYAYMAFLTDHRGLSVTVPKTMFSTAELNVAKHKKVVAGTFTYLREPSWQGGGHSIGDTTLQKLTDGRNDYFNGMAHSGDLTKEDQFAVIDLGRVYTLESHLTVWRTLAYPYTYEVHTSLDNKDWKPIYKMPSERVGLGKNIRSGGGDPLLIVGGPFPDLIKARYVKLWIPKGTSFFKRHKEWKNLDLAEIVLYPGGDYEEIKRIIREEWAP